MSNHSYLANENISPTFVAVARDQYGVDISDAKTVYGEGTDDVEDLLHHCRTGECVIITADKRIKQHIDVHDITPNGVIRVSNPASLKRNPDDATRRLLDFDAKMGDTTNHLSYLSDWTPA